MSSALRIWFRRYSYVIYLAIGIVMLALSVMFMMLSVSYMERAMVATSLISILIGFALLSSSLYVLRLSSYVYAATEKSEELKS